MAQPENGTDVVEDPVVDAASSDAADTPPADVDDRAWSDEHLYRAGQGAGTSVSADPPTDAHSVALRQEQERLAAERQARRDARMAALNPQPAPVAEQLAVQAAAPAPVVVAPAKRTTDKFLPSLGLFVLRLALAAIMGVHGLDKLLNTQRASEVFASTVLPQPQMLTLAVGIIEVGIAIALVFGLLTRVAGLGVALIAGGALAFVMWGPWSPFVSGRPGFIGELELLLVSAGVLLLCTGAGGWAVDRGFRARRAADRA